MADRFSLALGSGGAKGLAHIVALEALDELGVRPTRVAGASIGALAGALYCSGMSGKDIRAFVLEGIAKPAEILRAVLACDVGELGDLFSISGNPILLDPRRAYELFVPKTLVRDFEELRTPLAVVATDYFAQVDVVFTSGRLSDAISASLAIPGLFRPVDHHGRILIDGGTMNPLPLDLLAPEDGPIVAVNVKESPKHGVKKAPKPLEVLFGAVQVMSQAIIAEKAARRPPHLMISPAVGTYASLDFFSARKILEAAEPIREQVKRGVSQLLDRPAP